ncbi:MAG: polysaccharide deacetylase family protein [Cellulosilyticaceae bacterium]
MEQLVKKEERVVGNILMPLGDSCRMDQEEREKWNRWNIEIPKLTQMYPETVFMNGNGERKAICLTFDDAPDKRYTPAILDVLKTYQVPASFFVHGKRVERLKDMVKRIDEEGHYIGCHTYTHADLTQITLSQVAYEIEYSSQVIEKVIGKVPRIIRPPYGEINKEVVEVIKNMDKQIMMWSINTFDWLEKAPDNIISNILGNVRPGDVTLLHSYMNKRPTLNALPVIIENLKAQGYTFLRVDDMLGLVGY